MKLKQLASAVILATSSMSVLSATYQLTPVPVDDLSFNNFARSIDNTGSMIVTLESEYNPPIDIDLLDFDNSSIESLFEDPNSAERGVFSDLDYQTVWAYLLSSRSNGSVTVQEIATYRSYEADTLDADLIPGFDEYKDEFNDYSRSAYSLVNDSFGGDYFVGTGNGAFFEIDYETEDDVEVTYVLNDRYIQAFVEVNGVTKALLPTEDEPYYGYSEAFAINNALQVAGYGSAEILDEYVAVSENCEDEDIRGDVPEELCNYNQFGNMTTFAYRRAMIWQLDALGNVLTTTDYGLVFEPDAGDDSTSYVSIARDINNEGVAVGVSSSGEVVTYAEPGSFATSYAGRVAVAFIDGEVIELLDRTENFQSDAASVNDDNWVTGTAAQENSGYVREFMFVHNIDSGETIYPAGFFETAAVNPRAINNNGIIVGEGEFEADVQTNREVRAFFYDINVGDFIDLNTLLTCDQQDDYTLVSAVDINDNNEIIANARIRDTQKYITGEEVIDDRGSATEVDRIVAVKLTVSGSGDVDVCDVDDDEFFERQGASPSFWTLFALLGFAGYRLTRRT